MADKVSCLDWKGFTVYVLRPASGYDATVNGISASAEKLTVVGVLDDQDFREPLELRPVPGGLQHHHANPQAPSVFIHDRGGLGVSLVPANDDLLICKTSYIAGGNYATGDGAFTSLVGFYGAVAIHDRTELPW